MGFWQGDVKKLAIDMQALKPSIFPAVPRILNRLYDKVQTEVSASKLKSALFNFALNSKLKGVEAGYVTKSSMWDYIVFKKVCTLISLKHSTEHSTDFHVTLFQNLILT